MRRCRGANMTVSLVVSIVNSGEVASRAPVPSWVLLVGAIAALNLRVIRNIFMSWLITLPAGAGLSILFFFLLRAALD